MKEFRVKCIINGHWIWKYPRVSIKTYLFGLIKRKIKDNTSNGGPAKNEICTVTSQIKSDGMLFYYLAEYKREIYGNYQADQFVILQEEQSEFKQVEYKKILEIVPAGAN